MTDLKFFVLGSPRLERDGQMVNVERRRALALLAYLAVAGAQHQRDTLASLFWPEYDHTRGRAALRRTLAALTKALGGHALDTHRETIGVLREDHGRSLWLDVDQFHVLLATCRSHGHPEADVCAACLNPLAQAAALYRGDFLAGFTLRDAPAFDDWQLFQAETLRRELAGALERLVRGHSWRKEFEPAIGYARCWLALDPLHEAAHCSLMSLYAHMGQRQAALRHYAECARLLERELGVSPQPETTQLYEAIRDNRFAPIASQFTPVVLIHEAQPEGSMPQPSRALARAEQPVSLLDRIVRGALIGRERQVEQMRALLQRASDGEGHVLLLSGEAGVGKTRLVRELVASAKTSNVRVLMGGCHAEGSVPYAPIAQMIRAALDTDSDAASMLPDFMLADLLTLAPQLRLRYPQISPNPPLDPHYQRAQVFDSFVAWCATLASQRPLLLSVEDVHWADSGTLSLLRSLAQHVRGMPLLLVMTFRDTDVELAEARALKELVLDLNRERRAEAIQLMRLNREQTREMLATGGEISAEFLDSVYRETEGNPFFIEEVCKALIEAGNLFLAGGAWRRSDVQAIVVPQSVRAAILARVEKLPSLVQEILLWAAILGREFDFPTLQAMGDWNQETLIGALEQAERMQLLGEAQHAGQLRFAFTHALIPFALREHLSGLRRQRLHQRAALAIQAIRPNDVEALAHHYTAAGDHDQAITYAHRAAQRAESLYAYATAADYLRTALSLARSGDRRETIRALLEELADICRLRDERAEAIPLYEEALELARDTADDDRMAVVRLCRKIGETVVGTDYVRAMQPYEAAARAALEEGMQLMAGTPPHPETVRLLVARSHDAWRAQVPPNWDAAERDARAAIALAEQLDAPVEHSRALDALAVVFAARGRLRERVQITLERLALSTRSGFRETRERVHLLNEIGAVLIDVGEYAQALPYLREAERLASRMHANDELVRSLAAQATCAFRLDRWDEVSMDERFQTLREQPAHRRITPTCFHLALSAAVHALRGETAQARALREESLAFMAGAVPPERWGRTGHY